MAKTFPIDVKGYLYCDQRYAEISDVLDIQLDAGKYPTHTDPIPATILAIAARNDLPDCGEGPFGHTYTVSVADGDMPEGLEVLQACDISSIDCLNCCQRLEEMLVNEGICKWMPSTEVEVGDLRWSPHHEVIESLEERVTNPAYDADERSHWTSALARASLWKWEPQVGVKVGDIRFSPNDQFIESTADRETRATYDATEATFWTILPIVESLPATAITVDDIDQHTDGDAQAALERISRALPNHADYTGGIVTGNEVYIIVDKNARDVTIDGRSPDGSPEAPFLTIKEAVEYCQPQKDSRRPFIMIRPGTYEEDNPIQFGNGARIIGTTAYSANLNNKPSVVIRALNQGYPIFDITGHQYSGEVMAGHFYMWVDVGRGSTPGEDGCPDFSNVDSNWSGAPTLGTIFKATSDGTPTDWGTGCIRDLALVTTWADCQIYDIFFDGILRNGLSLDAPIIRQHRGGILWHVRDCQFRHAKWGVQSGTWVNGLMTNCFGARMGVYDQVRTPVVAPAVGFRGIWAFVDSSGSYLWDAALPSGTTFQTGDYVTRVSKTNHTATLYKCIAPHVSSSTWSISGAHAGATHATILTASSGAPFGSTNSKVGLLLRNLTAGCSGIVTANTGTTATVAVLTGGSRQNWVANDVFSLGDVGYWEDRTRNGDLEGALIYNDFTFFRPVLMEQGEENVFGDVLTADFSLIGDSTTLSIMTIINFQGDNVPCLVKAKHNSGHPAYYNIIGAETESTVNIHHWEHFLSFEFDRYANNAVRSGSLGALKVYRVVWCTADTNFSNLSFVPGRDNFAVGSGLGEVRVGDTFVLSASGTPLAYGHAVVIDHDDPAPERKVFLVNLQGCQFNFGGGQMGPSQGAVVGQLNTNKSAAAYNAASTYYPGDEVAALDWRDGQLRIWFCITLTAAGGPWTPAIQNNFVESEQPRVVLTTDAFHPGAYPSVYKNYETAGDFNIPTPASQVLGSVLATFPYHMRGSDAARGALEAYFRSETVPRYCLMADGEQRYQTNKLYARNETQHGLLEDEAGFGWYGRHRVWRYKEGTGSAARHRYETTDWMRRNLSNSNADAWQPHQTAGNLVHTGWYEVLVVGGSPDFNNVCTVSRDGTGTATAGSSGLTLEENTGATWRTNALVGLTIINETDGSQGIIESNTDTTVTALFLVGGSANAFASGDTFRICTWGMLNFGFYTLPTASTTVMTDSNANWGSNFLSSPGSNIIYNLTKGESGLISANGRTSVTHAALSGGVSWDYGDKWYIAGKPTAPIRHDVFQCIGGTDPDAWGSVQLQPLFRIPRMHTYPPWLLNP